MSHIQLSSKKLSENLSDGKSLRDPVEMMYNKGLQEDEIHTTVHEQLTDHELLFSTISPTDLVRKHCGGWDKENALHVGFNMKSTKNESPLKAKFFSV
jgi:hypothetical protein